MYKIARAKRAGHERRDPLPVRRLHARIVADVHEHVRVPLRDKRELAEVRVRGEVLERVQLLAVSASVYRWIVIGGQRADGEEGRAGGETHGLAEEAVGFVFVLLAPLRAVLPAHIDTLLERAAHERLGRVPRAALYDRHKGRAHIQPCMKEGEVVESV